MRGAMVFLSSILKRKKAQSSINSISSLFSNQCRSVDNDYNQTEEKEKGRKRSSYVLGPDLPDIWNPPNFVRTVSSCVVPEVNHDIQPTIIDGKSISEQIKSEISKEVREMKNSYGKAPGLAVILVGQRRDSQSYVRNKIKACNEVGIRSLIAQLPDSCSELEVLESVKRFNQDPSVHGILVQLPLPQHMDEERILGEISLEKDVDGFHPINMGNLALRGREPLFVPCAAKACIEILIRSKIELIGKHAVVIGRSKVVGLPTSLLLQRHHATVSIVHAYTEKPEEIAREGDIVISAAGVANLVKGSWLKKGVVVIDVGTNPVEDSESEHGYRLTGDVHFEEAVKVASAITPVPGGVGPVTITMLLSNTIDAAKSAFISSV